VGYAEGKDLFNGTIDVAVCDGFVGNLVLKSAEGVGDALISLLRDALRSDLLASVGMLMAKRALRKFKESIDWETVGGAPLIGVRGVGIVAHGRSSSKAIMNAIRVAAESAAVGLDPELTQAAKRGVELTNELKVAEG
jgi:glycerol-3-phosphate acyltransferase PlsX